jgi:hypothetical protein
MISGRSDSPRSVEVNAKIKIVGSGEYTYDETLRTVGAQAPPEHASQVVLPISTAAIEAGLVRKYD